MWAFKYERIQACDRESVQAFDHESIQACEHTKTTHTSNLPVTSAVKQNCQSIWLHERPTTRSLKPPSL